MESLEIVERSSEEEAKTESGSGSGSGYETCSGSETESGSETGSASASGSESDSSLGSEEEDEGTEDYCRGGYHPVRIGDYFRSSKTRYCIEKKLGWGHFSTVWLARDVDSDKRVALKVQKSAEDYTDAAFDEIMLFKDVVKYSEGKDVPIVKFIDAFKHCGPHGVHICMVFELLADNLYTLVQLYDYQGIPRKLLKRFAKQMLEGLDHLHRKCKIIHTDFKPENVLFTAEHALPKLYDGEPRPPPPPQMTKSKKKRMRKKMRAAAAAAESGSKDVSSQNSSKPKLTRTQKRRMFYRKKMAKRAVEANKPKTPPPVEEYRTRRRIRYSEEQLEELASKLETANVKIADLGNGCWIKKRFTDDIQTHEYRSPEVVLGASWGTAVDIWSMGCVMFEITTGDLLFKPRKDNDGEFDDNEDHLAQMVELVGSISRKFALSGSDSKKYFTKHGKFKHIDSDTFKYWCLEAIMKDKYDWTEEDAKPFADFLGRMLQLNPVKRETAFQLLQHDWLKE